MAHNIDKFSLPLRNGFNALNQVAEIYRPTPDTLGATVHYVNIGYNERRQPHVKSRGFHAITEENFESFREGFARAPIDKAGLSMLRELDETFNRIRNNEISIEEANIPLKAQTDTFLAHYSVRR